MVNSRRRAEVIDNARDHDAQNPDEEIEVNEPRFKSHLNRDYKGLEQGEHHKKENAGKHVRNQFSHAIKINKKI